MSKMTNLLGTYIEGYEYRPTTQNNIKWFFFGGKEEQRIAMRNNIGIIQAAKEYIFNNKHHTLAITHSCVFNKRGINPPPLPSPPPHQFGGTSAWVGTVFCKDSKSTSMYTLNFE